MYDIIFISYNEPNADINWELLKQKFPRAKRVDGVKGIHQAHIAAANKSFTKMFWVVDGDAVIEPNFNFDYRVTEDKLDHVFVWHSRNPINDLEYGYGGVKLLPTRLTKNMDLSKTDMTTSISNNFCVIPEVSNLTAFNTDEFSTWRSAFRECVKLASKTIQGQVDSETEQRLQTWCSIGFDRKFGEFAVSGACAGREYGHANSNNSDALKLINDFKWLEEKYNAG